MGDLAKQFLAGTGLLIFAFLLFSHGTIPLQLLNGTFTGGNATIKTLQGR